MDGWPWCGDMGFEEDSEAENAEKRRVEKMVWVLIHRQVFLSFFLSFFYEKRGVGATNPVSIQRPIFSKVDRTRLPIRRSTVALSTEAKLMDVSSFKITLSSLRRKARFHSHSLQHCPSQPRIAPSFP